MTLGGVYDTSSQRSWFLRAWNTGTNTYADFTYSANGLSSANLTAVTFGALAAGAWYFAMVGYDGTNTYVRVAGTASAPAKNSAAYSSGLFASTAPLALGAFKSGGTYGSFLNGRMDSAFVANPPGGFDFDALFTLLWNGGSGKIYNDLTAANKTALGLVSWYDLNETTGTRFDAHGTNHLTASTKVLMDSSTLNGGFETLGSAKTLGSELLANGGFETAGAGGADAFGTWGVSVLGSSTLTRDTTTFNGGAASCKMVIDGTGGFAAISQGVLTAGLRYRLTFWAKADLANGSYLSTDSATTASPTIATLTTAWTQFTFDFTASTASLNIKRGGATGRTVWIDDVSCKQITADPDVFASWSESASGSSSVNVDSSSPRSGTQCLRLDIDSSNSGASVSQSPFTGGDRYVVSLWAKGSSSSVSLRIDNVTSGTPITLTTSYAQYSQTVVAAGGNLSIGRSSATSGSLYIDDVTVTDQGPVGVAGVASAAATNGLAVSRWEDLSGNGRHFLQTTQAKCPTYVAGARNGRPSVQFDGVDDFLSVLTGGFNLTDKTVLVVTKTPATMAATKPILANGTSNWYVGVTATNRTITSHNNSVPAQKQLNGTASGLPVSTYQLLAYSWSVSGVNVTVNHYANGIPQASTTFTDDISAPAATTYYLGALSSSTNFYDGEVLEVLVYNAALTPAQMTQVNRYFAARYALTIT